MSDPRIYSGAEALALKAPATPGRWRRQRRAVLAGDDVVAVFTDERLNSHDPLSDDTNDCGCERGALLDALATLVADADLCAAAPDLAASVAHHEARATGLESLLLTFAADALGAIGRNPLPAGTHPVEAARYAAEALDNHFARAERAEADRDAALAHAAELERALREARSQRDAIDDDREALWCGVWAIVEPVGLDTPRDRADVIDRVRAVTEERDALRAALREEMAAEREARGGIRHLAARDALRRLATEAPDAR